MVWAIFIYLLVGGVMGHGFLIQASRAKDDNENKSLIEIKNKIENLDKIGRGGIIRSSILVLFLLFGPLVMLILLIRLFFWG